MKKYKELIFRIMNSPLGFAIVTNLFTLIMGLLVFRPFFETNDDLSLCFISEGAYGSNDYHLVYVNVILGKVLATLSAIAPAVRWHVCLQYLFILIAMMVLTFYLSHYKSGRIAAFVIQMACFYELYVSLQYTKTAAFITIVAVMLILGILKRRADIGAKIKISQMRIILTKKTENVIAVFCYVLLLYAMLLRIQAFGIAVLVAIIPGLIDVTSIIYRKQYAFIKNYAFSILPVFAVLLLTSLVDSAVYNSDPEWAVYKEYNYYRTQMTDVHYDALQYDVYGDELLSLGVSENDAYMYVTWQFGDEKVCNVDLLKNISSITEHRIIDIDLIKAWIENVYNDVFIFNPAVLAAVGIMGALIAISKPKSKAFALCAFESLFMVMLLLYFQYSSRWSHRLVYSALLSLIVAMIMEFITNGREYFKNSSGDKVYLNELTGNSLGLILVVMIVTVISTRLGNEFEYQRYLRRGDDFAVLQMYMEEEKDSLFVADTFTIYDTYQYDVFKASKKDMLGNFINVGGWMTASPVYHSITERYGYFDAFDALKRGQENVILIDNQCPDRKALYLSEHGDGPRYAAEYIENVCGYNLYKIK